MNRIHSNRSQQRMADHVEEQEMEAEALQAIFEGNFSIVSPQKWSIDLYPEHSVEDCNVACRLFVSLPETYPETSPTLSIEIITGLAPEHKELLEGIAQEEAASNEGSPSIFAVAERLREWLLENNVKGLDDQSMHAQMMRKKLQEENQRKAKQSNVIFEAQKQDQVILTEAEHEELTVRQRRAEGTPCNKENFEAWQRRFLEEQQAAEVQRRKDEMAANNSSTKNTNTEVDKSDRMTGYDFFMSKAGGDLAALEAAAEEAEGQALDEDLFKEEDDVDLDDLDFDEDDDDDDLDDDEVDEDVEEEDEELDI